MVILAEAARLECHIKRRLEKISGVCTYTKQTYHRAPGVSKLNRNLLCHYLVSILLFFSEESARFISGGYIVVAMREKYMLDPNLATLKTVAREIQAAGQWDILEEYTYIGFFEDLSGQVWVFKKRD